MAIYQQVMCATDYLRIKVHYRPMVGIICGTGLDSLADLIANPRIVRYDDIPGFPNCEVIGDEGKFIFGEIGGKHVVLLQRRLRTYESNDYSAITIPIRIIRLLGAKYLFVTTTAGGINPLFKVGDLVLVKDHVDFSSLVGNNPLIGSHNPRFGDHFPTLLGTYDKFLRDLAVKSMSELKMECEMLEGVYFHIAGPAYETPATSRMLQLLGCDVIGKSMFIFYHYKQSWAKQQNFLTPLRIKSC
nr:purine nucleoside phosphorylase [Hymenolepis microstoma]